MSLRPPDLDDRDFQALMRDALARIQDASPRWTDHSPSDPGIVLLDAFAYLTEMMIYRLNRVPEKAYVEFLRLMGVTLRPPAAAKVALRLTGEAEGRDARTVPRGTRVTVGQGLDQRGAPVFTTTEDATVPPGATAQVTALHAELVAAERVGTGTGRPGLSLSLARPPVVAPSGDGADLVIGVEAADAEAGGNAGRASAVRHDGRTYRVWREVVSFAEAHEDRFVYLADRASGRITFAPAVHESEEGHTVAGEATALAEVVPAGREVRAWYRRGGGRDGNVRAGALTAFVDDVPGVTVANPEAATGGRDAESLSNALQRGPQALHALERAVTAGDFERIAQRAGAVRRAKAFAEAALWRHGVPGTVQLVLVPDLDPERTVQDGATLDALTAAQTGQALSDVQNDVDARRPLGTRCRVAWARYKPVRIGARVVVFAEEDASAVGTRLAGRLNELLDPLRARDFGEPMRASDVYDVLLREPGVRYADQVNLQVDGAPDAEVHAVAADRFQPGTWYAGAGGATYRTLDDADGWERVRLDEAFTVAGVFPHPSRPGLVAVLLEDEPQGRWRLAVSEDCGETWRTDEAELGFRVYDVAWLDRTGDPVLLLATRQGLFQLPLSDTSLTPVQVPVDPDKTDRGFYAVVVSTGVRGRTFVAVAADQLGGVFLSDQGGGEGTFRAFGLDGTDVRVLQMHADGPRLYLWAGAAAVGGEPGDGCFRRELRLGEDAPSEWRQYRRGWNGGSCYQLAVAGGVLYAATHQGGVLRLDAGSREAAWEGPPLDCGLPLRDAERLLHPVRTVAARDGDAPRLLAGGHAGVHRSHDRGGTWQPVSRRSYADKVTLPPAWLFCPAPHQVEVVRDDEV